MDRFSTGGYKRETRDPWSWTFLGLVAAAHTLRKAGLPGCFLQVMAGWTKWPGRCKRFLLPVPKGPSVHKRDTVSFHVCERLGERAIKIDGATG